MNTRFKHKQIRCIQHQLGQRVYHDLVVQQAIMVMEAYKNKTEREVIFDTDSKPVGIDNCASAYISGDYNSMIISN
jgi:signal transduction histidine kinase